jgi:translation initiation factor 2B subunit (eIF-2B alpha/beta/delta family)
VCLFALAARRPDNGRVELAERLKELRADRRHGASFLARRAVEALVEVAEAPAATSEELLERVTSAGRQLAEARPGIAAVAGAVGRLLAAARAQAHLPPPELRRLIERESEALVASRRRAAASIAIQLRERLEGALVVTHSASATVREAVLHTPPKRLVCTVSHPVEEGRAFADELRASGLAVELVEDKEAPTELAGASLLLVGADTVFRDGTLCNKIGTRTLAEAAAEQEVPTIVACEVIKLAPMESAKARELPPEVRELFDLTPPELVHAVVTEEGTVRSDEVHALVDRIPFLREGYALLGRTP